MELTWRIISCGERIGGKVQAIRNIVSRHKIDRERLRIV